MNTNADDLAAIIAILCVVGLPMAYAISSRYFAHQERLAMIQRGITPPPDSRWAKRAAKHGWFDPSAYAQGQQIYDPYGYAEWQANRALRKGITLAMIGFALFVGLFFIDPFRPGPWLLGGLIPLFVGIAQIMIAVLGGARFGPFGMSAPPPPGPGLGQAPGPQYQQQPPPFTSGQNPSPGPYAWRPGPTTELEKPPSPPDTR